MSLRLFCRREAVKRLHGPLIAGADTSVKGQAALPSGTMSSTITLEPYRGDWSADDKDANFKAEVACYSTADPVPTLTNLSRGTGIPVGSLARYILVKWAASGSEALMATGPIVLAQMRQKIEEAESADTSEARLDAYRALREIVSWLTLGDK